MFQGEGGELPQKVYGQVTGKSENKHRGRAAWRPLVKLTEAVSARANRDKSLTDEAERNERHQIWKSKYNNVYQVLM